LKELAQFDQSFIRRLDCLGRAVLLFSLSLAVLVTLTYQAVSIRHRFMADYAEAPLVDHALRLAEGENIYRPAISTPPYTISNYPPLFVVVLTPLVKLFGPAFWQGRLISTLCAWLAAFFLAKIIYQHTGDLLAAWVTGMVFLASPYVVQWSSLVRVDFLAMALSVAALYYLTQWPQSWKCFVLGVVLLTAAIFTRQSYALAAPTAALFWLLHRDLRRALLLAGVVGGLSFVLFLGLNLVTHGGFYYNIVTANINDFGIQRLIDELKKLSDTTLVLLLLGAAFIFLTPRRSGTWPLVVPYLVGAGLASLTIGKIGSNTNYFLELCAALSLSAGALIAWSRTGQKTFIVRVIILLCLVYQTQVFLRTTLVDKVGSLRYWLNMYSDQIALNDIVANTDGPILADDGMGMIVLSERHLILQPFEVTQLAWAGKWDQTPLIESIERKEYPLILIHYYKGNDIHEERWTKEMLDAIERNYALTGTCADERLYRPIGASMRKDTCCR
jgi:4-amino-4-deoxy-L-arabinose transferase-like glycosyltransferase